MRFRTADLLLMAASAFLLLALGTWLIANREESIRARNFQKVKIGMPVAEVEGLLGPAQAVIGHSAVLKGALPDSAIAQKIRTRQLRANHVLEWQGGFGQRLLVGFCDRKVCDCEPVNRR